MGIKLNLTNDEIKSAQGGRFPTLAAGTYGAVIYTADEAVSKSGGNPMYVIDYKITDAPGDVGIGRKLRAWYAITPKALFKIVELHKAVGFPYPDKDTPAGEFEFPDADEYLTIPVNIKLGIEEYQGEDEDGNDATLTRNTIVKVTQYNEDNHTTEDEVADGENTDSGGVYL